MIIHFVVHKKYFKIDYFRNDLGPNSLANFFLTMLINYCCKPDHILFDFVG